MQGNPQVFGVGEVQTLTDGANIDVDLRNAPGTVPPGTTAQVGSGNCFKVTIGGNRSLRLYGLIDGQIIRLFVTQDGTGSRTLTPKVGGVASTVLTSGTPLSTGASKTDLVCLQYRQDLGQVMYYALAKDLA